MCRALQGMRTYNHEERTMSKPTSCKGLLAFHPVHSNCHAIRGTMRDEGLARTSTGNHNNAEHRIDPTAYRTQQPVHPPMLTDQRLRTAVGRICIHNSIYQMQISPKHVQAHAKWRAVRPRTVHRATLAGHAPSWIERQIPSQCREG